MPEMPGDIFKRMFLRGMTDEGFICAMFVLGLLMRDQKLNRWVLTREKWNDIAKFKPGERGVWLKIEEDSVVFCEGPAEDHAADIGGQPARRVGLAGPTELRAGPTGEFPRGKMNPDDKGELAIEIRVKKDGMVGLYFGVEVDWIGMTADDAEAFGKKMIDSARHAREHIRKRQTTKSTPRNTLH